LTCPRARAIIGLSFDACHPAGRGACRAAGASGSLTGRTPPTVAPGPDGFSSRVGGTPTMTKLSVVLIAAGCALLAAAPAARSAARAADDDAEVLTSLDGDDLADLIGEEGFRGAKVNKISADLHVVIVKMEGYNVLFFCDTDGGTVQAHFGLKDVKNASLRKINDWNESKKYFRAYIDKDGNPQMEADLMVKHGVTRKTVKEFISLMPVGIKAFVKEVCE
jgi:hypothetical protein